MSMKIPMTTSGIEPATFRLVAQYLNHCATSCPIFSMRHWVKSQNPLVSLSCLRLKPGYCKTRSWLQQCDFGQNFCVVFYSSSRFCMTYCYIHKTGQSFHCGCIFCQDTPFLLPSGTCILYFWVMMELILNTCYFYLCLWTAYGSECKRV
jgi:hypothetical protein